MAYKRESDKTAEERAEDIAYTINHSLYCTLTDFLNPPINTATDGWLRWLIPGCGHDHSHDHEPHHGECAHHHHHEEKATRWQRVKRSFGHAFSRERFIQYAKGEFIGDFGAVPLTIGLQRFFPGVMQGIRALTEPAMGPLFRWGVRRDSQRWARKHRIALDSPEFKEHADAVYEHEIGHFPQAVAWTGFSLALNAGYQMHADQSAAFRKLPLLNKAALKATSVLSGVVVTAGVVVAARALAPHRMERFDQWTSRKIILPSTKTVGKLFGVKEQDVDRMLEKEKRLKEGSWAERLEEPAATPARSA